MAPKVKNPGLSIQGISYGPQYGPLPSWKGSELLAPSQLKVVCNGAIMDLPAFQTRGPY